MSTTAAKAQIYPRLDAAQVQKSAGDQGAKTRGGVKTANSGIAVALSRPASPVRGGSAALIAANAAYGANQPHANVPPVVVSMLRIIPRAVKTTARPMARPTKPRETMSWRHTLPSPASAWRRTSDTSAIFKPPPRYSWPLDCRARRRRPLARLQVGINRIYQATFLPRRRCRAWATDQCWRRPRPHSYPTPRAVPVPPDGCRTGRSGCARIPW